MSHRVFIAIPISQALQQEMLDWERGFSQLPVRWLVGKNLHTTLVPPWYEEESQIPNCKARLDEAANGLKPFELKFTRVTFGPDPREPRLIWAEGTAPKEIVELRDKLLRVFSRPAEKRTFKTHLTLARFRPETFSSFPVKNLDEKVYWPEKVSSVVLMESHLSRDGADYEVIAEAGLDQI